MKLSKWITGAALLFTAQIASVQGGQYGCDPCDPCYQSNPCDLCDIDFCDVEYDVYVDALYWKLCRSNLVYVEEDGHYLDHDWHWGYRIGANARYKNWDLGLRYTSFCVEDKSSFEEDFHFKHDFDYDVLDIEVGYTCCLPCNLTIRPIAGAKLAWIDDKFKVEEDDEEVSDSKVDFDGYGLYLGLSSRWELCSYCMCDRDIPLALVTRATTGILHGDFCYHVDGDTEFDDLKDECLYVQVSDLYVGLDMTFCDLCGWDAFFQVGYEIQHWGDWREFFDEDDLASWGFGGLVLRFGASF